jgi:acid stress chaperone HdeB
MSMIIRRRQLIAAIRRRRYPAVERGARAAAASRNSKRHWLIIISGAILAGTCLPAQAQMTLDVSKITCDQFVGYKITNPRNIALWLSGYYNGKRGNTIIDTQELEQNSEKVQDYCRLNPKMPVMQAVEAVFDLR